MRKDRIKRLVETLKAAPDEKFGMAHYFAEGDVPTDARTIAPRKFIKGCGTAACIAGWAMVQRGQTFDYRNTTVFETAEEYLGLDRQRAANLFVPNSPVSLERITRAETIETLERLHETGEVVWPWDVAR